MPANERRFWPSPKKHKHILGEVKRVYIENRRVVVLMIYEQSVYRDATHLELPVTRGKLLGDMDEIYCTICKKAVADWRVGEDALDALLSRVVAPSVV